MAAHVLLVAAPSSMKQWTGWVALPSSRKLVRLARASHGSAIMPCRQQGTERREARAASQPTQDKNGPRRA